MPNNGKTTQSDPKGLAYFLLIAALILLVIFGTAIRPTNQVGAVKQSQEQLHAANYPARFNQGDKIYIGSDTGDRSACTVGYVDKQNNRLYTARHCLRGENIAYNANNQPIGKGYPVGDNDVAIIQLEGAAQGENKYSTDARPVMPTVGDQVCGYGSTTQRPRCGHVTEIDDSGSIRASAEVIGAHGDSGGPVWEKSTGNIIGLYRGEVNSSYSDGTSETEALIEYFR